jgi:hypothetical protein
MSITEQLLEIHRFSKSDDVARMKYIKQVVSDCTRTRNLILNCYNDFSADEACGLIRAIITLMPDDQLYELRFAPDVFFAIMERAMTTNKFSSMIAEFAYNRLLDRFLIKFKNYLTNEEYPQGNRIYEHIIDIIDKCTY